LHEADALEGVSERHGGGGAEGGAR
jgi:hypothetical protein